MAVQDLFLLVSSQDVVNVSEAYIKETVTKAPEEEEDRHYVAISTVETMQLNTKIIPSKFGKMDCFSVRPAPDVMALSSTVILRFQRTILTV